MKGTLLIIGLAVAVELLIFGILWLCQEIGHRRRMRESWKFWGEMFRGWQDKTMPTTMISWTLGQRKEQDGR